MTGGVLRSIGANFGVAGTCACWVVCLHEDRRDGLRPGRTSARLCSFFGMISFHEVHPEVQVRLGWPVVHR